MTILLPSPNYLPLRPNIGTCHFSRRVVIEPRHLSAVTLQVISVATSISISRIHIQTTWYGSENLHAILDSKWDTCIGNYVIVRYTCAMTVEGKTVEATQTICLLIKQRNV